MKKALPLVSVLLIVVLLAVSLGMIRYVFNSFEANFNRLAAGVTDTNPKEMERAREVLSENWSLYETWRCGGLSGFLAIGILIFFVCHYPKMFQANLMKSGKLILAVPAAAVLFTGALGTYIGWQTSIVPLLDKLAIVDLTVAWRVFISCTYTGAAYSLAIAALWLIYFLFAQEGERVSEG
jgi:hypothetical protein